MPFHFCADELLLIMTCLPFVGVFFRKVHVWWHAKKNHEPHKAVTHSEHKEQ